MKSTILACILAFILTGCVATGDSDPSQRWDIPSADGSGVKARVTLPSILRRPTLVTYSGGNATVHDLDRWGSALEESLERNLSALLADAPVQDVVVRVQKLEVSTHGNIKLVFDTKFTLTSNSSTRVTTLRGSGMLIEDDSPTAQPSLKQAIAGYAKVPRELARSILESVAQEQGGVAKPAPGVTVPGK